MNMANTRIFSFVAAGNSFSLAVNPKETTITDGSTVKTAELLNVGEIGIAGQRKLIRVSVSTFLPAFGSHFYNGMTPEAVMELMRKVKNGRLPVRIIISDSGLNREFLVEKLDCTYKEGQKDWYINWSFIEYRETTVIPVASIMNRYTDTGICQRTSDQEIPKKVTVKENMTLWALAKKYYGDGGRWKEIAQANENVDEKKLKIGMELMIP